MTKPNSLDGLMLTGLDGSNPLAFLAALGTLRALTLAWPDRKVKMAWVESANGWRPFISYHDAASDEEVIQSLDDWLQSMGECPALNFADNLSVGPAEFRIFAQQAMAVAQISDDPKRRVNVDFAAAFGCDSLSNEQGKMQDTALRTMSGAGHQHFLAFMRHIVSQTSNEHLRKTLFEHWTYEDAVANQTLRWDPADDSRYALQWRDPSGDPSRKQRGGMLGANRLAIEGLPLITCAPVNGTLQTTGFIGRGSRNTFWIWPLWTFPASLDVCRSILAHPLLTQEDSAVPDVDLRAIGIDAAFRSQRITVGKFRNFTSAVAVF